MLGDEWNSELERSHTLGSLVRGEPHYESRSQYDVEFVRYLLKVGFSEREIRALLVFNQYGELWLLPYFVQLATIRRIKTQMAYH